MDDQERYQGGGNNVIDFLGRFGMDSLCSSENSDQTVYKPSEMQYTVSKDRTGGAEMDAQEYFNILREDRQQMEQRITEERRLLEDRIEKRINESMSRFDKTEKAVESAKNWIIGICITTMLAIAGMVIAILVRG